MVKNIPQSLLFPADQWTKKSAVEWLKTRGFRCEKVVKEGNHYRARQFDPALCDEDTYGTKTWWSRKDAAFRGRRKPKKILAVFCRTR